jgi:hypothetical protein
VRRGLISVAIFAAFVIIYTLSRHAITTTTTTTTTTSTTIASTTTSTSTTGVEATSCQPQDFNAVFNEGQGAAGTVYASVTLTKSSSGSCTLHGWPVVTLQDRLGAVLSIAPVDVPGASSDFAFLTGTAADLTAQANRAPTSVSLGQNQSATFALAYSDVAEGNQTCPSGVSMSVQFAAGGATVAVSPPSPIQPCDNGQLWLSPFYAAS